MFGISTSNGTLGDLGSDHRPEGELRAHDEVGLMVDDRRLGVGGVGAQRSGELRLEESSEQLAGVLALPVAIRVVLRASIRPVRRGDPATKGGARRLDLLRHRIFGKDNDVVAPLDEPANDAELDGNGAAAVDEGDEVAVGGHRLGSLVMPSRTPSTSWTMIRSVSARLRPRSRRSSFHVYTSVAA